MPFRLTPVELSWTSSWTADCPKCETSFDSSAFACPACGKPLLAVRDRRYNGYSAQLFLRCENACATFLVLPCPNDKTLIQGRNLSAGILITHRGYVLLALAVPFVALGLLCLKLDPVLVIFWTFCVSVGLLLFLGAALWFDDVLDSLFSVRPAGRMLVAIWWLFPKRRRWYEFSNPSQRDAYRQR